MEYACRVLAQLGRSYGRSGFVHIEALADSESIPAKYLVQILNELRNGGLITSRRGKQGGYALAKAPADITLVAIIHAVEGELLELNGAPQGQSGRQVARIWKEIAQCLEGKVGQYTLAHFMPGESGDMYHI